ncbi:MAG: hypothetical protein KAR40_09690 [Candidatus Sabulitectum sp.]|nr:hypothetical protein [Candidatus Sabulitectum sp.]
MATPRTSPFRGGAVTARERITLRQFEDWEEYSMIQNFRGRRPGFEVRLGMARHHDTADASTETMTLYQFSKGGKVEYHFFRQLIDGSVQEATDNPPATTAGIFGSDILGTVTNPLPATWGNINDACLFGDGVRAHQISYGVATPVSTFIVFPDTTVPNIPEVGEDYSVEVSDGRSSTVAVLDGLGANEFFFVKTPMPAKTITITVTAANGNAATLTMQYWKGTWNTVAITDNTDSGGATLAQTGTVTWTAQSDEIPHYLFGESGFWYKFKVGGALDAEVKISAVTFEADWQATRNVWDGVLAEGIEAKVYNSEQDSYYLYSTSSIDVARLVAGDYIYVGFIDPLAGLYVDVGATPNIIDAEVVGSSSISFFDNGSSKDVIRTTDANFLSAGFEEGQSITISGTSNNNKAVKILQVTSIEIFVETGNLTGELNTSATIQVTSGPLTTALDEVAVWTGSAYSVVTSLTDGTAGLTKSGFVTWDRTSQVPRQTQFSDSPFYAYWYRFKFDKTLSSKVNLGVLGIPYFDISDLGNGVTVGVWKERALYSFDPFGQYLHVTARNKPTALNGFDYAVLEAGDGRLNKVRSTKQFHNEILVWQEERGEEGGCTTLFEGYDPSTFGKLLISSRIGILNGKCSAVVDGVLTSQESDQEVKTLVFWLSRYGLAVTDGQKASLVSDDIRNYFDPQKAECIRRGYEDKHWLRFDSTDNVVRMGLVSGSSATLPNIFPVFDVVDWKFSFDELAEPLACMAEVEAASGNVPVLQYGGGADDGYVYRMNTGTDDIVGVTPTTTAINAYVDVERNIGAGEGRIKGVVLRCKAQAAGNVSMDAFRDTRTVAEATYTFDMTPVTAGDAYRKDRENLDWPANHFTLRFSHNAIGEKVYLLDSGMVIQVDKSKL